MGGRKWRERERNGKGKGERSNRRKFSYRIPRFLLRPREFFPFLFLGRLLLAWRRRRPCDEDDHHEGGMRNIKGLYLQSCGLLSLSLSLSLTRPHFLITLPSPPPFRRRREIPILLLLRSPRGGQREHNNKGEAGKKHKKARRRPVSPSPCSAGCSTISQQSQNSVVVVGEGHLAKKVQPHSLGRGDCCHGNFCHSSPFLLHTGECVP